MHGEADFANDLEKQLRNRARTTNEPRLERLIDSALGLTIQALQPCEMASEEGPSVHELLSSMNKKTLCGFHVGDPCSLSDFNEGAYWSLRGDVGVPLETSEPIWRPAMIRTSQMMPEPLPDSMQRSGLVISF